MSPIQAVLAVLAIVVGAFIAVRWRERLVMSLPYLVTLSGVALAVGGSSVRVDQLVACLLVVPLAAGVIARRHALRVTQGMWWLAAIFVVNVAASLLHSPVRQYSLLQCLNLASAWAIYPLLVNMLTTREELERFFGHMLMAGTLACSVAVGAYVLSVVGLPIGGAETGRAATESFARAYGAYGTMVEPNILGSFAGAQLLIALTLWSGHSELLDGLWRRRVRVLMLAAAAALLLSFTRSAWVGAVVGVGALMLTRRRGNRVGLGKMLIPLAAAVLLVAIVLTVPSDAATLLRFKLANLFNVASPTAAVRLIVYGMAIDQLQVHPIIGWGTFTFAALAAQGADFARYEGWRNLWIGNYLLLALHDTGIIGLALWTGFLWSTMQAGVRARKATLDGEAALRITALLLGVVTLLVAYLATSGFTLGYPWLVMGLLAAYARHAMPQSHAAATPAPGEDPAAAQ